jgi:hypothetical protein
MAGPKTNVGIQYILRRNSTGGVKNNIIINYMAVQASNGFRYMAVIACSRYLPTYSVCTLDQVLILFLVGTVFSTKKDL